jgi:hypothetical protein
VPQAGHLDRRGLTDHSPRPNETASVNGQPNIVDGHGPDATSPPGPELARLTTALRRSIDLVVRPGAAPELLDEAAGLVEQAADLLEATTRPWTPSVPARPLAELEPHNYFPSAP